MYSLETVLKQRKKEQILKDSRSHATKHATSIAFTHTPPPLNTPHADDVHQKILSILVKGKKCYLAS